MHRPVTRFAAALHKGAAFILTPITLAAVIVPGAWRQRYLPRACPSDVALVTLTVQALEQSSHPPGALGHCL
jgi:hypothetical protein